MVIFNLWKKINHDRPLIVLTIKQNKRQKSNSSSTQNLVACSNLKALIKTHHFISKKKKKYGRCLIMSISIVILAQRFRRKDFPKPVVGLNPNSMGLAWLANISTNLNDIILYLKWFIMTFDPKKFIIPLLHNKGTNMKMKLVHVIAKNS